MKQILVLLSLVLLTSCVPPGNTNDSWIAGEGDLPEGIFDGSRALTFYSGKLPPKISEGYVTPSYSQPTMQTTIHYTYAVGCIGEGNAVAYVDSDEVLVGGGASVICLGETPAMLTASYPFISQTRGLGWIAQSKNRVNPTTQILMVYAIGLKLNDLHKFYNNGTGFIPAAEVQKHVKYTIATSTYSQHPSVTAMVPSGYDVIAGGGFVWDPNTEDDAAVSNFLTASYPRIEESSASQGDNWGSGWTVSAKEHCEYRPARVTAYAISIPQNSSQDTSIDAYGDIRVSYRYGYGTFWQESVPVNAPASTQQLSIYDKWGGCLTGVGGLSDYTGAGRMLNKLQPLANNTAVIRDTYETVGAGGTLYGVAIKIQYDDMANY